MPYPSRRYLQRQRSLLTSEVSCYIPEVKSHSQSQQEPSGEPKKKKGLSGEQEAISGHRAQGSTWRKVECPKGLAVP